MSARRQQTAEAVHTAVADAVRRSASALYSLRSSDGSWPVPLSGGAALEADFVLLEWWRDGAVRSKLIAEQLPDGGFSLYPGGGAHLDTSIKAYVALRITGRPTGLARDAILRLGGVEAATDVLRLVLSFFGLFPRARCVAPEQIDDRELAAPLLVLDGRGSRRPVGFEISELFSGTEVPRGLKPAPLWRKWFRGRSVREAEAWLNERRNSFAGNLCASMALGQPLEPPPVRDTALATFVLRESGQGLDLTRSREWLSTRGAGLDADTAALVALALRESIPSRDRDLAESPDTAGRLLEAKAADTRTGVDYLFRAQQQDGTWRGRWGVSHIYGTCHALRGLQAAGVSDREAPVLRGGEWLRSIQNADGGWGESCASDAEGEYVPGPSTPSQTAWAVLGLLAGGDRTSLSIDKGIEYLVETQNQDGTWDEAVPTATGIPNASYLTDPLYRNSFPLLALSSFLKQKHEVANS